MRVGIERINGYTGRAEIDVRALFEARGLDLSRFENLMMAQKSIGCPWEDAVTFGVNAARPILDQLGEDEKSRIELLITASESGVDFGKSLSTYLHDYLGLSRRCRLFEVKQACYGGTAGLQMAASQLVSQAPPGAKALVVATDVARATARHSYAEPSQAVASVAMLVGDKPNVLEIDLGAYGIHGYEVMDTCRPQPELETGDADLSLLSYLDCLGGAYKDYAEHVEVHGFQDAFNYLVFHTPFAGMVKGAHRKLMRDVTGARGEEIETDFNARVMPSLEFCTRIGNAYSASLYLALISLIDNVGVSENRRVGLFSYGSGCCSEFYSGIVSPSAKAHIGDLRAQLDGRRRLSIEEYDALVDANEEWPFGLLSKSVDRGQFDTLYRDQFEGRSLLVLERIENFHRKYVWS